MNSRCLGSIDLAHYELAPQLRVIDELPARGLYSEYAFGAWHSHVLANPSGDVDDDEYRPASASATPTALGREFAGLQRLIADTFELGALRWARLFTLRDGLLITHVDFIEFGAATTRLSVPLRTNPAALHSEGEAVFHLDLGEIWQLDATTPHAACAGEGPARVCLCLDFDVPPDEALACLRPQLRAPRATPALERPPLSPAQLDALLGLGSLLEASPAGLREVLRLFAGVHFHRRAHATACFDWLIEAARRVDHHALVERALAFRRYCLERRDYGERFIW